MILIIGRSGSGKDYLAELMRARGLKILKSYTTRPKRTPQEDSHIFITKEEAATFKDKVATTTINGYEYFATAEQVRNNDAYIIDPRGFYELTSNMPNTRFTVLYVHSDDKERKERAIKRAANKSAEARVFDARNQSEDQQFTQFESIISSYDLSSLPHNARVIYKYENRYDPFEADNFIKPIVDKVKPYKFVFKVNTPVDNIKDSMQLSSGTTICELESGDNIVSIEVHGDVNVVWNNEIYRDPAEFPLELKKIIASTYDWYDDPRISVNSNNWFEIMLNGGECYDVIDVEGHTELELFTACIEMLPSSL